MNNLNESINMIANRNDVLKLTAKTEKALEQILSLWNNPGCATEQIGNERAKIVRALSNALEVNSAIIYNSYNLE